MIDLRSIEIEPFRIRIVGFEKAYSLRIERATLPRQTKGLRKINHIVDVRCGDLFEMVPSPGKSAIDQPCGGQCAVVPHHPVSCAVIPLRVRGSVIRIQGAVGGSVVGVGITEDRGFDGVRIIDFESQLAGVILRERSFLGVALIQCEKAGTCRGGPMLILPSRIECAEIEKVLLQRTKRNITAQFRIGFVPRVI